MKRPMLIFALFTQTMGCANSDGEGEVGAAQLSIQQVPPNVSCLQIDVTNGLRSVVDSFDVTATQNSTQLLKNLPVIQDVFTAFAYDSACAAVTADSLASYTSDAVSALVEPGKLGSVTLTLRASGAAVVGVDFSGCQDVVCPSFEGGVSLCVDGACKVLCDAGFDACEQSCVHQGGCCTPADCPQPLQGQATCTNGVCGAQCMSGTLCPDGSCFDPHNHRC